MKKRNWRTSPSLIRRFSDIHVPPSFFYLPEEFKSEFYEKEAILAVTHKDRQTKMEIYRKQT